MPLLANAFPNGLGESTGDDLVTTSPLYTDSIVRYVSSVLGSDTNTGLERKLPKATLASAITASIANGIIVLASDHDETLVAAQSVALTGLIIVGAGSASGVPTATLRINSATADLMNITADNVQIRNILFPTAVQSNTGSKIIIGAGEGSAVSGGLLKGCRFECTGNDQGEAVHNFNNDNARFETCTFVVTESTGGTPPANGLLSTDVLNSHMTYVDCVFDGGTVGFASGFGLDLSVSVTTKLRIENASLLNGADMVVEGGSGGRINVSTSTGSARVIFA